MTSVWQVPAPVTDEARAALKRLIDGRGLGVSDDSLDVLVAGCLATAARRTRSYIREGATLWRLLGAFADATDELAQAALAACRHAFLWRGVHFEVGQEAHRRYLIAADSGDALEPTQLDKAITAFVVAAYGELSVDISAEQLEELVDRMVSPSVPFVHDGEGVLWDAWWALRSREDMPPAAVQILAALATYAGGEFTVSFEGGFHSV